MNNITKNVNNDSSSASNDEKPCTSIDNSKMQCSDLKRASSSKSTTPDNKKLKRHTNSQLFWFPDLKRTSSITNITSDPKKIKAEPSNERSIRQRSDPSLDKDTAYTASGVKSSLHGTIYQLKLLMLFAKRGICKQYDFRLATEMDAAEKFDDVVFKFKKDDGKFTYRFLQAKHKLDPQKSKISINDLTTKTKSDFSLQKYFISFCKIQANSIFNGSELKDFIICTNTDFDFEINREYKIDGEERKDSKKRNDNIEKWQGLFEFVDISCDDILYLGKEEKVRRFKRDAETKNAVREVIEKNISDIISEGTSSKYSHNELNILKKILANDFTSNVDKFLENLIFITNYPSENDLGGFIKSELGNEYYLLNADLISDTFEKEMLVWLKSYEGQTAKFYSWQKGEDLFRKIRNKIGTLITIGFTKNYLTKLESYNISFNTHLEIVAKFLSEDKQVIALSTQSIRLTALKVHQTLNDLVSYIDGYIFIGLKSLFNEDVLECINNSFINSQSHNILVIECPVESQKQTSKIMNLYMKLSPALQIIDPPKKIILITQGDDFISKIFQCSKQDDSTCFEELDSNSQALILEKRVNFQGKLVELNRLIDKNLANEVINHEHLMCLVKGQKLEIGNEEAFSSIGYVKDCYIERSFHRQKVNAKILQENVDSELFFITGEGIDEYLTNLNIDTNKIYTWQYGQIYDTGIVVLHSRNNDRGSEIYQNMQKFGVSLHWLEYQENNLTWRASGANLSFVRSYIYETDEISNNFTINEDYFIHDCIQKVVILANDPGVGKSTVLTSLAHKMKQNDPTLWISVINLNDFTDKREMNCLENIKFGVNDVNGAIDFVAGMIIPGECENVNIKFQRNILKAGLQIYDTVKPKIVILFDGFDEISPNYKEKTRLLLKALISSDVVQLWVTTRVHEKVYLEDELNSPAYIVSPLTEREQVMFFYQFWSWKLNSPEATCVDELQERIKNKILTDELLDVAKKVLKQWNLSIDDKSKVFSVVPLNLKMLAEVAYDNNCQLPETFNLLCLYDTFVTNKFNIYFKDKGKMITGNVVADNTIRNERERLRKVHYILAAKLFLPDEKVLPYLDEINTNLDGLARIGLLILKRDCLLFIHRSFAEYLFSEYLIECFHNDRVQIILITEILLKPNFALIRQFLNGHFKNIDFSVKELNDGVKKLLLEQFESDDRTAVHAVAHEGHTAILDFLLNKFKDAFSTLRNLLLNLKKGQTPLHLAAMGKGNRETVELLLNFTNKNTDMVFLKEMILMKNMFKDSILHGPAVHGNIETIEIILNFVKNHHPTLLEELVLATCQKTNTALHWLVEHGNPKHIEIFLENIGVISIKVIKQLNKSKETVFFSAVHSDVWDALETLLNFVCKNFKADFESLVLAKNCYEQNLLHYAVEWYHHEIIAKLLKYLEKYREVLKKLIMEPNDKNLCSLHLTTMFGNRNHAFTIIIKAFFDNFGTERESVRDLMLKTSIDEYDIFHLVINKKWIDSVNILLEGVKNFPDILTKMLHSRNKDGETPLDIAEEINNSEIIHLIREFGQIEITNKQKISLQEKDSFYNAVRQGRSEDVRNILTSKDNKIKKQLFLETDLKTVTVLHLAIQMGHTDVVKLLLMNFENDQEFLRRLMLRILSREEINLDIIETYFEPDSNFGKSVLGLAIEKEQKEIVEILLKTTKRYTDLLKDLVMADCDDEGNGALQMAVQKGYIDIMKLLLTFTESEFFFIELILKKNYLKRTVLHLASWNYEIFNELFETIKNKPFIHQCVNEEDYFNQNSLQLSAFKKQWKIVVSLLKVGANVKDLTDDQCTSLSIYLNATNLEDKQELLDNISELLRNRSQIKNVDNVNVEMNDNDQNI